LLRNRALWRQRTWASRHPAIRPIVLLHHGAVKDCIDLLDDGEHRALARRVSGGACELSGDLSDQVLRGDLQRV
jgi:hypothetical protein